MATSTDLPRLRGAQPTLFNTTASLFGLAAGGAAYGLATYLGTAAVALGSVTLAAPIVAAAAVGLAGTVLGGFIGKAQMAREVSTGVAVSTPSFLNKGLVNGLFIGAAVALGMLAAPAFGITLPAIAAGTLGLGVAAAAPAALGSLLVRSSQSQIYALASRQADIVQVTRQAEAAKAKGLENVLTKAATVSPEEAATLEARQNAGRGGEKKSFAEQVLANREVASGALAK